VKFGLIGPAKALPAARFAALAPAKKIKIRARITRYFGN
jgi:hypothetical protein